MVGGTGGMGAAVVQRFARSGASVSFTYLRAEETARSMVAGFEADGLDVHALACDLRDDAAVAAVVDAAADDGGLDAVVLAAASGTQRRLDASRPKHWDFTYAVNVRGLLSLYRAALPALAARRGSLVATSALGGERVIPSYGLVGAAKSAVESLVRYAATEAGQYGVRVNAVRPGVFLSKAIQSFPDHERMVAAAIGNTPLGRLVEPDEVAAVVTWLVGPDAAMITGQTITVDGGWELCAPL